jgi:hypothetical protein
MDPYLGEIRIFAGNFAPQGWGNLIASVCAGFSGFRTREGLDKVLGDARWVARWYADEGPSSPRNVTLISCPWWNRTTA